MWERKRKAVEEKWDVKKEKKRQKITVLMLEAENCEWSGRRDVMRCSQRMACQEGAVGIVPHGLGGFQAKGSCWE